MSIELEPNTEAAVAQAEKQASEAVQRAKLIVERSRALLLNQKPEGEALIGDALVELAVRRDEAMIEIISSEKGGDQPEKGDGDISPSILPRLPA